MSLGSVLFYWLPFFTQNQYYWPAEQNAALPVANELNVSQFLQRDLHSPGTWRTVDWYLPNYISTPCNVPEERRSHLNHVVNRKFVQFVPISTQVYPKCRRYYHVTVAASVATHLYILALWTHRHPEFKFRILFIDAFNCNDSAGSKIDEWNRRMADWSNSNLFQCHLVYHKSH